MLNWLSNSIFLHKRFKESRSRSMKDRVNRGLGQRLNKQKNHSFREGGMDGFSHLYIQMHCLLLLLTLEMLLKYLSAWNHYIT